MAVGILGVAGVALLLGMSTAFRTQDISREQVQGENLARSVQIRHSTLTKLLEMLGIKGAELHRDVEGIEHHVSPATLSAISQLVVFMEGNPSRLKSFRRMQKRAKG